MGRVLIAIGTGPMAGLLKPVDVASSRSRSAYPAASQITFKSA